MALPVTLMAGVLMFSGVQASDIADGSKSHAFLSKYISPVMTYSDMPVHPAGPTHDTMDFTSAQAGAFRTSKDLEPQKMADKVDIGLCLIGVALLSFAAMLGVRMRRGMQPLVALASSGGNGIDMSVAPVEGLERDRIAAFFVSPHQPRTMQTLKPASEVTVAQPLAAPTRLFSVVERGTSALEDTEGLGAEFEDALVIDDDAWDSEEAGDEDLLAGFDLENADVGEIKEWGITPREVCAQERAEAKTTHRRHDTDCGSSEVQIALFTARIKHITDHVISNPKDHASRRGLLALVSKRRRLINYLYSRDADKATKLCNDLGIRFRFKSAMPDRTEKYRQYTIAANKKMKR